MTHETAIDHFRERAAIVEYDGELPRPNAESLALREVARIYGKDAAKAVQRWRDDETGGSDENA